MQVQFGTLLLIFTYCSILATSRSQISTSSRYAGVGTPYRLLKKDDPKYVGGRIIPMDGIKHHLYFRHMGHIKCMAALIKSWKDIEFAVTTAQCVHDTMGQLYAAETIDVVAGAFNLNQTDPEREQTRNVSRIMISKGQVQCQMSDTCMHDVAFMFLTTRFEQTNWVKPLELEGTETYLPDNVIVSGWGAHEGAKVADLELKLRSAHIPTVNQSDCKSFSLFRSIEWKKGQFCVGEFDSKEACSGYSGAPAIAYAPNYDRFYLVGVGITPFCANPYYPMAFARAAFHLDEARGSANEFGERIGQN